MEAFNAYAGENPSWWDTMTRPRWSAAVMESKARADSINRYNSLIGEPQYNKLEEMPQPGVLRMEPQNLALSNQVYGPNPSPQYRQTFTPDASFFARAAGIPGYQDLASGMQREVGAMDRQIQGQQYSGSNMSLYESEMKAISLARLKQQELESKQRTALEWAKLNKDDGPKYPGQTLKGKELMDALRFGDTLTNGINTAQDIMDWTDNTTMQDRAMSPGDKKAAAAALYDVMLPYIKSKYVGNNEASDKLMERISTDLNATDAFHINSAANKRIKGLIAEMKRDETQHYGYFGATPPQYKRGSSAWAQSRNSGPTKPKDIVPYTGSK